MTSLDPFGTTHYDRTGQTQIKEESVTDHLDRAAEVIAAQMHGLTTPGMCRGIARALEEAGMLVTPEHDAEVRADERGRCSVIHATLDDEALVDELVRRGVLRGEESLVDLKCGDRQPVNPLPSVVMCCSGEYVTQRRYVTAWEPAEGDEGSTCD